MSMEALRSEVHALREMLDGISTRVGVPRNGEPVKAIAVKTGWAEWLKICAAVLIPTAGLTVGSIRAYDAHDSRISAVEKAVADQTSDVKATHDGVLELKVRTEGWDNRLKGIEAKLK